ncbi:hypothetical protein GCM10020366_38030 [Saccharopolyspora gregorii]|uniref:Uncharacterized protein n=1 Tax=Saccharopolyspora gregorii TaxID=33914 RepID=A0ABP6RRE5_9PSEU
MRVAVRSEVSRSHNPAAPCPPGARTPMPVSTTRLSPVLIRAARPRETASSAGEGSAPSAATIHVFAWAPLG